MCEFSGTSSKTPATSNEVCPSIDILLADRIFIGEIFFCRSLRQDEFIQSVETCFRIAHNNFEVEHPDGSRVQHTAFSFPGRR